MVFFSPPRWFHGACVGIPTPDHLGMIAPEWFCDSCQLSKAVEEQRRRITRLLGLSEGGFKEQRDADAGLELLCSESETTKQLLLNYVQRASASDAAAESAHRLLLCRWHCEAERTGQTALCSVYRELHLELNAAATTAALSFGGASAGGQMPLLSRKSIVSASRKLLVESALFKQASLTSLTCRAHVARKPHTSRAQVAHKLRTSRTQAAHKLRTSRAQAAYKSHKSHKPHTPHFLHLSQPTCPSPFFPYVSHTRTCSFLSQLERALDFVLTTLKEAQPSARARAIKAVNGVVSADPSTLELVQVRHAMETALREPSIAVREATLDMLGKYIISCPEFVERYYETIVKRLCDVGISVRKRVIKILRDLCIQGDK